MKLIIAGSRNISDQLIVEKAIIKSGFENIEEIVCGCAKGIDMCGYDYGIQKGIFVKTMPAIWFADGKYDRNAGFKRNERMAKYADALLAIWDGYSHGTKNMIMHARNYKLKTFIYLVE